MTRKRRRYDRQFKVAAAQVVLSGDMRVVNLAKEPGIKDPALRRWAQGHGEMGDAAFPGNGSPKAGKDFKTLKRELVKGGDTRRGRRRNRTSSSTSSSAAAGRGCIRLSDAKRRAT